MIARLITWSARNIVLVLVLAAIAILAGVWAVRTLPFDAVPDTSDTQVIVYTEFPGQAPQVVEDQVTYPLTSALLTVPRSKTVRGFSFFGASYVYVIFADGTDTYWARSRVLESLAQATKSLPPGVTPALGPDASGVGWVYQYALTNPNMSLADLRSLQDWDVRFKLAKAEGVAEVAGLGGFVKQYSIVLDPGRLRTFGISLAAVRDVVRASNIDVGGRTLELAEHEFMVRGRGYLKGIGDLEKLVIKADGGTPVLLKDVARIELTGDERRGIGELNGEGEAAGGIVVQRAGSNALDTISSVKSHIEEIAPSLPEGTSVVPVYDRSDLITRAISTLKRTLIEESLIVALVCFIFLAHLRSALVAILVLPVAIIISFIGMRIAGVGFDIMSLGGIALAVGAMIDAAIIMIENAHKHLERAPAGKSRSEVILEAAREVGPALFFSLLVITVSFLPIFALQAEEGRLFTPLALTKTFAMAAAALLSVTLVPALMMLLIRGPIHAEFDNPLNRMLAAIYRRIIDWALRHKSVVLGSALASVLLCAWPVTHFGREFMPELDEGTLLYMPTTPPGISVTKAAELLQTQDRIIRSFPEVQSVFGKAGRAQTASDPAPMEMFETIINLKPHGQWRPGLTREALIREMDEALQFPGVSNAWTQPIRARIDMQTTGIRTPVGVKVLGNSLASIENAARQIETALKDVPGTASAYGERVNGGYYLEIIPNRDRLARYGLAMADVQQVIAVALGAETVTTTVEGRERYGVTMRYPRTMRSDAEAIAKEVHVALPAGSSVPLGEVADIVQTRGAANIRTEDAKLATYVYVDIRDRDLAGYVASAKAAVAAHVDLPAGVHVVWSGQYESMQRAEARLLVLVPLTLLVIVLLLYLNFGRMAETLTVLLSLPFALVGGIWLCWWMNLDISVAVIIGFIALAGVAAETGVVMLHYLDRALRETGGEERNYTSGQLHQAVMKGAVERLRPKMMTVLSIIGGLMPILWSSGAGSEVMTRIAVPMIGGMISSAVLTLVVIPVLFVWLKSPHRTVKSEPADIMPVPAS